MLTGIQVAGLVFGPMGLVPIFKEAYKLAQARRQGSGASDTAKLAEEARNGETSLVSRYQEFHSVYGDAFKKGDGIARERLKDLIIQLQHGLLIELQRGGQIYNPASLVTITITGRIDAFTTLSELAQRLATAMPIVNRLDFHNAEETQRAERPYQSDNGSAVQLLTILPKFAIRLAIAPAMLIKRRLDRQETPEAQEKRRLEMTPSVAQRLTTTTTARSRTVRRLNPYAFEEKAPDVESPYGKNPYLQSPPPPAFGFAVQPDYSRTTLPTYIKDEGTGQLVERPRTRFEKSTSLGWLGCDVCKRKFEKPSALKQHCASASHRVKVRDHVRRQTPLELLEYA